MTSGAIAFTPGIKADGDYTNYWIRQVVLRLRREVSWCWHERAEYVSAEPGAFPPFTGRISTVLDMTRFADEKRRFFSTDPTARYLTDQIQALPLPAENLQQGSFCWVANNEGLDEISAFALATGLLSAIDSAAGTVMACCMNDPVKTCPSFSLIQILWDDPAAVLSLTDPRHPLFANGLLRYVNQSLPGSEYLDWDAPLSVPPLVARQLLFPGAPLPASLVPVEWDRMRTVFNSTKSEMLLYQQNTDSLSVVPIRGAKGCRHRDMVMSIATANERSVVQYTGDPANLHSSAFLNSLLTVCWLRNLDLFLDDDAIRSFTAHGNSQNPPVLLQSVPVTLFIGITGREVPQIFNKNLMPAIEVPSFTYHERMAHWETLLGMDTSIKPAIAECSRRYRFEAETISAIAQRLKVSRHSITAKDIWDACRAESDVDLGDLAQRVMPRFDDEELILPPAQNRQFREVEQAMRSLTEVHYGWGLAKAWNESGISVLFAGPPGSGKTMAAELLAHKLGLPLFRIDLSQVVNKYIGETEKNLKKLFDAAEIADMILFFDEADALFGRRTEVRDAHDRYANLEISYLLERMERFKGLAILATNRKKDLDEAFLRRLRFIIDFPFPEIEERERIWKQVLPKNIDTRSVDIGFLSRKFPLAGGHIRSVVLNACLQSAGRECGECLTMESLIVAVKREYDKIHRPIDLDQFGPYAGIVRELTP